MTLFNTPSSSYNPLGKPNIEKLGNYKRVEQIIKELDEISGIRI
jgi:hypothetical protein